MTRSRLRLALAMTAAAFALAACPDVPPVQPPPPQATCGAGALQDLVGQPASVLDTMRFAGPIRVVQPGMAVTMDYRPDRLTISIGTDGTIARVACG